MKPIGKTSRAREQPPANQKSCAPRSASRRAQNYFRSALSSADFPLHRKDRSTFAEAYPRPARERELRPRQRRRWNGSTPSELCVKEYGENLPFDKGSRVPRQKTKFRLRARS